MSSAERVEAAFDAVAIEPPLPRFDRLPVVRAPGKRVFDIALTVILLPVLVPTIAVAALLVVVFDRHAPFFRDERVGLGGRLFRCWKIRTMLCADDLLKDYLEQNPHEARQYAESRKLTRDPRITRLGRFLRSTSIDEAPQFLNVLKGDMSIVGPRPLSPAEFARRGLGSPILATVRPGITGLWQVSGRSLTTDRRRHRLEILYCRRRSFWMDLWIVARTPLVVVKRTGAR